MIDRQNNLDPRQGWGIRTSDQSTVAVVTAVAIALIIGSWVYRGGLSGRVIEIDTAAPAPVAFQLDVNRADWPEWTLLPGIGEKLAKRIVQNRSDRGPFQQHEDLLRVSGIGPRTLRRMTPYLLPLPDSNDLRKQDAVAVE